MPERATVATVADLTADDRGPIDKFVRTAAGELRTLAYDMGMAVEPAVTVVEVAGDRDAVLEQLAARLLHVDTLEVRNSDQLDFHDCHVGAIGEALREAYELGRAAGTAV